MDLCNIGLAKSLVNSRSHSVLISQRLGVGKERERSVLLPLTPPGPLPVKYPLAKYL